MSIEHYDKNGRRLVESVPHRRVMDSGWYTIGSVPRACYYPVGMVSARVLSTAATLTDRLYAIPAVFQRRLVIDSVSVNLTGPGGVGIKGRAGIYRNASEADAAPGVLLETFGEFTLAASGVKTISGLSRVLNPNELYWFVYHAQDGRTFRAYNYASGASLPAALGVAATLPTTPGVGWFGSSAYASGLPATFPAVSEIVADSPILALHFSA